VALGAADGGVGAGAVVGEAAGVERRGGCGADVWAGVAGGGRRTLRVGCTYSVILLPDPDPAFFEAFCDVRVAAAAERMGE